MLTELELMTIHIQALFTHDSQSRLLSINEPGGGPLAPRMFFGRTRAGNMWRFRADLPETLIEKLESLCVEEPVGLEIHRPPRHAESYVELLEPHAPGHKLWLGPAYHFPEQLEPSRPVRLITKTNARLLRGGFEKLISELSAWQPFLGFIEKGQAVSICRSVRITHAAHEAGVETLPEFRGKGYAKAVTAGWARIVHAMGAIPLYSTSWENSSSQEVARKLHLVQYGTDFHIR